MKMITRLILLLSLTLPVSPGMAESEMDLTPVTPAKDSSSMNTAEDYPSSWTTSSLPEIIIRPVGVAGSAAGIALFVLGSPFSGIASIAEPHDAFEITYRDFVKRPFDFTFRRPIGEWGAY